MNKDGNFCNLLIFWTQTGSLKIDDGVFHSKQIQNNLQIQLHLNGLHLLFQLVHFLH